MYVALNISNRHIQLLSLKGKQVKKWGSHPLAEGLVRDGLILQPQAVGEAIDSLFKTTRIPRENVIFSIAGLSFTYRFLVLPHMKTALLEEAILRAAKKEISLPLEELYLSWQAIPGGDEEQEFFVLGIPRNLVDTVLQTLSLANVEPYLMDLRPLALARTAGRGDAIVVSLEPDCFDIVFIAGGIPRVIHTFSPRSDGATLEDNIRRLVDELSKTAAFYQSSHPESKLGPSTPLLLTGEMSAEAPAIGLLQGEVEYAVEPLSPPVEVPSDLPVETYATSIGLALKKTPPKPAVKGEEARFHDININILSGKYRKKKTRPLPAGYIILGVLLTIAIIFLFPLYQGRSRAVAENAARETELNRIDRQVNLASLISQETASQEAAIRAILESTESLNIANRSVLGNRGDYTRNLQVIRGALPPGTSFTSIDIDDFRITARGETDSVYTVIEYARTLEAAGAFSEVRISMLDEDVSIVSADEEGDIAPEEAGVIIFEILVDI